MKASPAGTGAARVVVIVAALGSRRASSCRRPDAPAAAPLVRSPGPPNHSGSASHRWPRAVARTLGERRRHHQQRDHGDDQERHAENISRAFSVDIPSRRPRWSARRRATCVSARARAYSTASTSYADPHRRLAASPALCTVLGARLTREHPLTDEGTPWLPPTPAMTRATTSAVTSTNVTGNEWLARPPTG